MRNGSELFICLKAILQKPHAIVLLYVCSEPL